MPADDDHYERKNYLQGFSSMKVIGFDPMCSVEATKKFGVTKMELEEIWPLADHIRLHTLLILQTRNLVNATSLAKSKKGVRVINVARGGIVDEEALLASLKSGHCGGAALDVFTEEPPKNPVTLELIQHPKVIATPHLGASTAEAQQRVAVEIAEQFLALSGKSTAFSATGTYCKNPRVYEVRMIRDHERRYVLKKNRFFGN